MGAEISSTKSRTVSQSDGSMSIHLQNNYHPLHFHTVHGENIKLLKSKQIACRHEGFCKGIVFSDRPISVREPVYVKFVDISSNWSGALRIGFTSNDPTTMKSKLPRYACPDLTTIPGNWVKAIAERMAKKDSVLHFFVDQNGDVHYGIDSEEHGIFFGGVNVSGKLWAVLDIYGNTVTVEFIDPSSLNREDSQNSLANESTNENQTNFVENIPSACCRLAFHTIQGKNITFKSDRTIASRKANILHSAYVFTQRPLELNEKVLIRVLKIDNKEELSLIYGITSCNPLNITSCDLPMNADDLMDRPEYWIVKQDFSNYKTGDYIIYSISDEGEVTVSKNLSKSALFHVDQTQPLWLFLNICGSISEVSLMGTMPDNVSADIVNRLEKLSISVPLRTQSREEVSGASSQQNTGECVICCEDVANCALYRCGHVCMCYPCASKMFQRSSEALCPICREVIQDIIKIYT